MRVGRARRLTTAGKWGALCVLGPMALVPSLGWAQTPALGSELPFNDRAEGAPARGPALPGRDASVVEERDTVEISPHASVKLGTLVVDNRLGDVTVVGRDEPGITLTAVKRAPDTATLDRLKVSLMPDPAGSVHIESAVMFGHEARPVPIGLARIDIILAVPRTIQLTVKAWDGKLVVSGMRAGVRLTANEADVDITDVRGLVSSSSARGTQRMRQISGSVLAENTFGDLAFDDIGGDSLLAMVHDGSIEARHVTSQSVKFRVTQGSILFEGRLLPGGRYDLRSYRGDVRVRFVSAAPVRIEAHARRGTVDSQLDVLQAGMPASTALRTTWGRSRQRPSQLELHSVVGNIFVGLMNE